MATEAGHRTSPAPPACYLCGLVLLAPFCHLGWMRSFQREPTSFPKSVVSATPGPAWHQEGSQAVLDPETRLISHLGKGTPYGCFFSTPTLKPSNFPTDDILRIFQSGRIGADSVLGLQMKRLASQTVPFPTPDLT